MHEYKHFFETGTSHASLITGESNLFKQDLDQIVQLLKSIIMPY